LLKILCLAIFFAFFCRKSDDDKEANEYLDENQIDLDNDEEYIHSTEVCLFFFLILFSNLINIIE
jgi:hypothetical protein